MAVALFDALNALKPNDLSQYFQLHSPINLGFNMTKKTLTDADHTGMDNLINAALDGYKNGTLSRDSARRSLAHVIAAIDIGNYAEAREWFKNPGLLDDNEKRTNP